MSSANNNKLLQAQMHDYFRTSASSSMGTSESNEITEMISSRYNMNIKIIWNNIVSTSRRYESASFQLFINEVTAQSGTVTDANLVTRQRSRWQHSDALEPSDGKSSANRIRKNHFTFLI